MNERIQEFKIQACKWASENASSAEYENAADQKFAELIVRECAALFPMQFTDERYQRRIDHTILKHFDYEKE